MSDDLKKLHKTMWDVIRANAEAILESSEDEWDGLCAVADDLADDCDPNLARKAIVEAVAAVNALPELLALREENERLRAEFPAREKQAFVMGLKCAAESVRETSGGSVVCERSRLIIADSLDHAVENARAALETKP